MTSAYVLGLRAVALSSLAISVYVLIGSLMFPRWWYGLFWGHDARLEYVKSGTAYLIDHYFRLSVCIILLFSAAVLSLMQWGVRVFPWIDRFAGRLVFCTGLAILLDALFLRRFQRTAYRTGEAAIARLQTAFEQIVVLLRSGPNLDAPIFFHYLDGPRVEALYSQVAELRLRERSVTLADKRKGKAELRLGPANLGMERGAEGQRTDTLEAPDFSTERKCVELMRHVLETLPRNCYTDVLDSCLRELGGELSEPLRLMVQGQHDQVAAHKFASEAKDKWKVWFKALEQGLHQVSGCAFVYGEFERSEHLLIRKFSDEPFKCHFRLMLPQEARNSLPAHKVRLTVFGSIVRPLGNDGFVDIAAVAIF